MTEPRCPFRMKGFDQPDTCDEKCAWLMRVIDYDQRNSRACAMSVIAMRDEMNEWVPANITDVNANDGIAAGNDVSEASVDANDVNAMQDSREKLEADAIWLAKSIWQKGVNCANRASGDHLVSWQERDVIDLLDRQAAITEQRHLELTGAFQLESDKRITELQAKVDELTSELAAARKAHAQAEHEAVILREKLGRMLDCSHDIERIGQI